MPVEVAVVLPMLALLHSNNGGLAILMVLATLATTSHSTVMPCWKGWGRGEGNYRNQQHKSKKRTAKTCGVDWLHGHCVACKALLPAKKWAVAVAEDLVQRLEDAADGLHLQ